MLHQGADLLTSIDAYSLPFKKMVTPPSQLNEPHI